MPKLPTKNIFFIHLSMWWKLQHHGKKNYCKLNEKKEGETFRIMRKIERELKWAENNNKPVK